MDQERVLRLIFVQPTKGMGAARLTSPIYIYMAMLYRTKSIYIYIYIYIMRDTTTKPWIACDDCLSSGSVLEVTYMAEQDAPKSRPRWCVISSVCTSAGRVDFPDTILDEIIAVFCLEELEPPGEHPVYRCSAAASKFIWGSFLSCPCAHHHPPAAG